MMATQPCLPQSVPIYVTICPRVTIKNTPFHSAEKYLDPKDKLCGHPIYV